MQMVIQGVWIDDSGLRNLPFFDNKLIDELYEKEKCAYLCQLIDLHKKGKLVPFLKNNSHKFEVVNFFFKKKIINQFNELQI